MHHHNSTIIWVAGYDTYTVQYVQPFQHPRVIAHEAAKSLRLGEQDTMPSSIPDLVRTWFTRLDVRVVSVELQYSQSLGPYLLVLVDAPAREALKAWMEVAPAARSILGLPVFVVWTGENNLEPEELGTQLGKILARMGVHLATEEVFDATQLLREEWSG